MITQVSIGGILYRVQLGAKEGEERPVANNPDHILLGKILYHEAKIYLEETQDPQAMRVTLWHEIIHGILEHAGQSEARDNEPIVHALSYGLTQLIRDNGQLIEWTRVIEL
jgi:hypothetical protein